MSQLRQTPKEKSKSPQRIQAEVLQESGASLGAYITEGEDRFIIGSSKRADLVVPHSEVSNIHAMLRLKDSNIFLYDLGSEGGTFVAGQKIVERKLNSGEIFEIGGQKVRVQLIDHVSEKQSELALFWQSQNHGSPDRIGVIRLEDGLIHDERILPKGANLRFGRGSNEILLEGTAAGQNFLRRKNSGNSQSVEAILPQGFIAEIYSESNETLRVIEQVGSTFSFNEREKVRFASSDQRKEILIFWQEQGVRSARQGKDAESPILKKTLGSCLALAMFLLTIFSFAPLKKEVIEEAVIPKSSYERISMESAPAAAAPQSGSQAEGSSGKKENQPTSSADSISSSLSKLLNKKSSLTAEAIQQSISTNGSQTVRNAALKNANIKSQEIAAGTMGGGSVNLNALSAGLSSGSGTKAGSLNGFANGKGTSIGGSGLSGFGGKGFDMSLGGDETEAMGGLDKTIIASVVQSNIGQIKHCYEKQLIVDPNIFGKVVVSWTIDKDGAVSTSSIKKTTMNNKAVENCIASKIKNWTFPKPKGGGQVLVSYPFLFKSLN